jgi:large subunit ribosomal protein L9
MATQVILLERIEKLGGMGDIVTVKPGYARNYLLPLNKALRATDSNIAYFETQKSALEKVNNEKKKSAETHAKSLKGLSVAIIRQAGEGGQLYGSVTARDIADSINTVADQKINRNMVDLNQSYKEIGLYDVIVTLHPEVKETIQINIARTEDEAKTQAKTGKALIADDQAEATAKAEAAQEAANDSKAELMEEGALEAEKEAEAKATEKATADAEKATEKAEAKAAKKAAAPVEEEGESIEVEASADTEEAPAAESTEEETKA